MCQKIIEDLQQLIRIPSTSKVGTYNKPYGEEAYDVLKKALEICAESGLDVKNCNNRIGWAEVGAGIELMGILVHLDVVPAGSDWTKDPFGGQIVDDKIYGRGTIDDKGPAIACVHALKELIQEGQNFKRRVRIIFGLSEESGDWSDMEYYKNTEEIPSLGFTPDADFPVIYGEKGILHTTVSMALSASGIEDITGGETVNMVPDNCRALIKNKNKTIEVLGKGESAHGSTPEDGINAISIVMEKIAKQTKSKFADFYVETIGFTVNGEKSNLNLWDEPSGKLTLNAGKINVADDRIELDLDIRYPVTFSRKEVEARLCDSCQKYGVKMETKLHIPPVFSDKNSELIRNLLSAYREITGDRNEGIVMGGGTYARAMDNIVAFGPVFPGQESREHKSDEFINVKDLNRIKSIYKLAIKKLAVE